jgi:predicted DNA-binding transcriptional regulator AlpA
MKNKLKTKTAYALKPSTTVALSSGNDDDAATRKFLTGPQVQERYGISDMSLWRWLKDAALNFPQPTMWIRDRRFWLESDLIAWERSRILREDEPA